MKLDIGSGGARYAEDFITVDKYTSADIDDDMRNLTFGNDTVDEIWCSHALEHIAFRDCAKVLQEFYRVLKSNGTCTITVPDFDWVASYWMRGYDVSGRTPQLRIDDPEWAESMVFGNQVHEGEFHKSAWSREKMKFALLSVGFRIASLERLWDHDQQSIRAVCSKP